MSAENDDVAGGDTGADPVVLGGVEVQHVRANGLGSSALRVQDRNFCGEIKHIGSSYLCGCFASEVSPVEHMNGVTESLAVGIGLID